MKTETRNQTDLLIHPGESLQDAIDAVGMSQQTLADRMGVSRKHVNRIIQGKELISVRVANLLERVLGTPASFWISLTKNYEADLAVSESTKDLKSDVESLSRFPTKDLVGLGLMGQASNKVEQLKTLLAYFGVGSMKILDGLLAQGYAVAYRKAGGSASSRESLASWIRAGQLIAERLHLPSFDKSKLEGALPRLVRATLDPRSFEKEARAILTDCGVALVIVPCLKGTVAHGATFWVRQNSRPVIQLSLRHKFCDIIFFTMLHEIGHILLHPKSEIFVEMDKHIVDQREEEADRFAGDLLIPSDAYRHFIEENPVISTKAVLKFAMSLKAHPCVVIGRLQKEDILSYKDGRFAPYKPRFAWEIVDGNRCAS